MGGRRSARAASCSAPPRATTLNGEGLQHEDGHSHIFSSVIPNCLSYDPTYGYEVAVIIQDGLRRMVTNQEDIYYYLSLMNENYEHPAMPQGVEGDPEGDVSLARIKGEAQSRVQLLGSGTILREVEAAAELLEDGVSPPTCGARRASLSCGAMVSPSTAGTCCIRKRSRKHPM